MASVHRTRRRATSRNEWYEFYNCSIMTQDWDEMIERYEREVQDGYGENQVFVPYLQRSFLEDGERDWQELDAECILDRMHEEKFQNELLKEARKSVSYTSATEKWSSSYSSSRVI